jgi:hypothetical protein
MSVYGSMRIGGLLLAMLLAACATPDGGGGGGSSKSLPEVLSDVRQHPENRTVAIADCQNTIARTAGDIPIEAFSAGLFDVPEETGRYTLCAAMVEAVISGGLSQADMDNMRKQREAGGKAPLGIFLRKLLIAHERLKGQQAKAPTAARRTSSAAS